MRGRLLAMIAHEGGWDEVLWVAAPIMVVVALLALAQRRIKRSRQSGLDDTGLDDTGCASG